MLSIFHQFWLIAQLKSGPESLPTNNFLLLIITALNVAVNLTISVSVGWQGVATVATTLITSLAARALIIYGLLSLVGKPARLTQTLTAHFGCDLLMKVVAGGCILVMGLVDMSFMTTLAFVIFLWGILILGFILHKAMEVHMAMTLALAFLLTLVTAAVGQLAVGQT